MNIDKAIVIANDCARAKRIAGLLADVPYSQAQLCDVIATLFQELTSSTTLLKADAAKANRRYAAANARYEKLAKQTGKHVAEVVDETGS